MKDEPRRPRCRTVAAVAVGAAVLAFGSTARAGSGATLGEQAVAASLADAVTARAGDLSSIFWNPGALASLEGGWLDLTGHVGRLGLFFGRADEPDDDLGRTFGGVAFAVATQLPGPEWLRAFRLGFAVHLPAAHVLRFVAPSRSDEPSFPLYGTRVERTSMTATVAYQLFSRLGVGVGVTISPTLDSPTHASYDPTRGGSADENVAPDIERTLSLGAALVCGVRTELADEFALGFAFRQHVRLSATGFNDVEAGALSVKEPLDFRDFVAPDELSLGMAATPVPELVLSLDGVLAHWSAYRTIHDEAPPRPFSDVVQPRFGAEWTTPFAPVRVRLGYAYEPSPIPEQDGATNLLGGSAHVVASGAGLDLEQAGWAPVRIDGYFRAMVLERQTATKDPSLLGDAAPALAGQQIQNLGYPGLHASGWVVQGGLTVSLRFGGGPADDEALEETPP